MATSLDNLNITISARTKTAVDNVNKLVGALDKLKESLNSIDTKGLEATANAANKMSDAFVSMKNSRITQTVRAVAKSTQGFSAQAEAMEKVAEASEGISDAAKTAAESLGGVTREVGGGGASSGMEKMAASAESVNNVITSLKAGMNGFTGTLKTAGSLFGNFAKKAASSIFNLKKFKKAMSSSTLSAKSFAKELTRIGKMFKLMITRMVLRQIISGIGDGFKNLAQYSAKFNASISLLWNSFRQLGNSIAAAVSPLLNAFAPALNYLIQLIIKAVNAINQLVSALLGLGTWTRAKTLTDSYADSLKKAGGAAKELKKTVLGFDELNQLQDNKNSGGGGATSPADMFEEAGISDKWKKWADKLKEMWEKADFTELGNILGRKLLEALNKIPWTKIKKVARKIGKSLATLINGFVEVAGLGEAIGKTIAEAINTGFEFANAYVHNLHWDSIGRFIADTFNGFFKNIDWAVIKDTVVTGLRGIADSIMAFSAQFDWNNISKTIVNALDVVSAGIKAFFERMDFKDLGQKVGEQIAKVIKEADWKQIGEAIGDIVQSGIDFFASLVSQLSITDVLSAIQQLLEGFFNKADGTAIAKIVSAVVGAALLNGVLSMSISATKLALETIVKTLIKDAVASQAVAEAGKTAMSGALGKSVADAGASETVATAGKAAGTSIAGYILAGLTGAALGVAIGGVIKDALFNIGIKGARSEGDEEHAQILENAKNEYKGFAGTIRMVKDVVTGDWAKLTTTIRDDNGEIVKAVKGSGDTVIKFVDDTKSTQKSLEAQSAKLRETLARTGQTATQEAQKAQSAIGSSTKDISGSVVTMSTTIEKETYNVKQAYAGVAKDVPVQLQTLEKSTTDTTDSIKKSFDKSNWTFSGVAEGLSETFKSAVDGIKSIWNGLASSLSGSFSIGNKSFNINLPRIYATGGFPEDGLFMANHNELVGRFSNGKTAVANNEQITDGIARAVYSAITAANGGGGSASYINNTIEIDGVAIARAVTKGQSSLNRRYSPTMA